MKIRIIYKNLKEILLIPVVLAPAGVLWGFTLMWFFFNKIDRTDLFISAISSNNILILLSVSFIWLATLLAFIVFLPSLYFHLLIKVFYPQLPADILALSIFKKSLYNAFIIIFIIFILSCFDSFDIGSFYLLLLTAIVSLLFTLKLGEKVNFLDIKKMWQKKIKISWKNKLYIFIIIFISSTSTVFPTNLVLHSFYSTSTYFDLSFIIILIVSMFFIIVTYLPIYIYLKMKSNSKYKILILFFFSAIIMGLLLFSNIFIKIFETSHLIEKKSYLVLMNKKDYPLYLFDQNIWEVNMIDPQEGLFTMNVERLLNLSDKTLICPKGTHTRLNKNSIIEVDGFSLKRLVSNAELYQATEMCMLINNDQVHFKIEKHKS
ncbi:hypothetical protein RHO14_04400 [Orbus wheelerorum]|uniref:hypothetical protein n=1 Tax=Orbus wheelerorum TaxID=3074111 RepID=UPI00370DBF0A